MQQTFRRSENLHPETKSTAYPQSSDPISTHQPLNDKELTQEGQSFQFLETAQSAILKEHKLPVLEDAKPSTSRVHPDTQLLDVKKEKSTTRSNSQNLYKETEDNLISNDGQSFNLNGDLTVITDIENLKLSAREYTLQQGPLAHNPNAITEDSAMDISRENDRSLNDSKKRIFERKDEYDNQMRQHQHSPFKRSWFTGYKQLQEEKKDLDGDNGTCESVIIEDSKEEACQNEKSEKGASSIRLRDYQMLSPTVKSPKKATISIIQERSIILGRSNPNLEASPTHNQSPPLSPLRLRSTNRMDESPILNIQSQPVSPWHLSLNFDDAQTTLEAKLYLKRTLSLILYIALLSVSLFLKITDKISFNPFFALTYCYLAYYGIESIVRACFLQREHWRNIEDVYNALDAFSGIIFLLSVELKISKFISVSMMSSLPFLAILCTYKLSKAPKASKIPKTLIRCFFTVESFIVTSKLDKIFDWDWELIFDLNIISFGIIGLILIVIAFKKLFILLQDIIKHRIEGDMKLSVEFIGIIWSFIYSAVYIVIALSIFAFSKPGLIKEDYNLNLLNTVILTSISLSLFLILYTLISFRFLIDFFKRFERVYTPIRVIDSPQSFRKPQVKINLEVQENKSYFVMLSSTYFLPLKNGFAVKKEENIKRIKRMLSKLKLWRSSKHRGKAPSPKPANIQELKEDQKAIDTMFTKVMTQRLSEGAFAKASKTARAREPMTINLERGDPNNSPKLRENLNTFASLDTNRKHNLSADDYNMNRLSICKSAKIVSEENLCYLCYENPPNTVLLNCGHGGICYECASALVKKKNECMECRSTVEAFYKVDVRLKVCDIVKGFEVTKVSVSP